MILSILQTGDFKLQTWLLTDTPLLSRKTTSDVSSVSLSGTISSKSGVDLSTAVATSLPWDRIWRGVLRAMRYSAAAAAPFKSDYLTCAPAETRDLRRYHGANASHNRTQMTSVAVSTDVYHGRLTTLVSRWHDACGCMTAWATDYRVTTEKVSLYGIIKKSY